MAQPERDIRLPSMPMPWNRVLAFVDLETTGVNPSIHDIIDAAVIRDGLPWSSKIRITEFDERRAFTAEDQAKGRKIPKAFEVNGYNRGEWASAPHSSDICEEFARQLHGAVFVAHNAPFDISFCESFMERNGIPWRTVWCGSMIDTYPLAKAMLGVRGLKKFSLQACCEFLGIEPEGVHRALGGASRVRLLFWELCKLVAR